LYFITKLRSSFNNIGDFGDRNALFQLALTVDHNLLVELIEADLQ